MSARRTFCLALFGISLIGCTSNQPSRTGDIVDCSNPSTDCTKATIERYNVNKPNEYDLAFLEFTDRGNLFSRTRFEQVRDHIQAAT
jgi:hypothetical protein